MSVTKSLTVSLLAIALLSTAGLAIAAAPHTPQTPGPGQEIQGDVPVTPDGKGIIKGIGVGGGVTLESRDIRGTVHWRARGGASGGGGGGGRIDSFFDVFFDITYRGQQETGSFRVDSFFDVFTEFHPPEPGAGIPEQIRGQATNDFEYKFMTPAGLDVRISSFFDVFAEYSGGGGGGGGGTFMVSSFFDVFTEIATPPMPGAAGQVLASYSEQGKQANVITDDSRGGAMSQTDSFFDVFTELSTGPGGGNGQADSFFDVFLDVSPTPGKGQERKQGGQQLEYRARSHTAADYELGDKTLLLNFHRGTTQLAKVTKIDAFTLKQKVVERDIEKGTVPAGDSETRLDSFFDITYRIDAPGRPPVILRGTGVWTGLAMVHYEPPVASRSTAVARNAAKGINSPNLLI